MAPLTSPYSIRPRLATTHRYSKLTLTEMLDQHSIAMIVLLILPIFILPIALYVRLYFNLWHTQLRFLLFLQLLKRYDTKRNRWSTTPIMNYDPRGFNANEFLLLYQPQCSAADGGLLCNAPMLPLNPTPIKTLDDPIHESKKRGAKPVHQLLKAAAKATDQATHNVKPRPLYKFAIIERFDNSCVSSAALAAHNAAANIFSETRASQAPFQ